MRTIVVIAHNLRSCHNVGSLLRTAEGLGIARVYLTGYTPYPQLLNDDRLPHIAAKIDQQIHKTALGAEHTVPWERANIHELIASLRTDKFSVVALEQTSNSQNITSWNVPERTAIVFGREVEGMEQDVVDACDLAIEIPMFGSKESFNVVQAAAMAMFYCRFSD